MLKLDEVEEEFQLSICIFLSTKKFKSQPISEAYDIEFPNKFTRFMVGNAGLLQTLDTSLEGEAIIYGRLRRVRVIETTNHEVKNELTRLW